MRLALIISWPLVWCGFLYRGAAPVGKARDQGREVIRVSKGIAHGHTLAEGKPLRKAQSAQPFALPNISKEDHGL
jgi:hypothetical protein